MGRRVFLTLLAAATVVCIIIGLNIHTGMLQNGFRISISGNGPEFSLHEEIKTEVLYSGKDAAGRGNSGVKIPDVITGLKIEAEIMDVEIVRGEELYVEYTGSETYRPMISSDGSRLLIIQKTKNVIGINFSGSDNSLLVKLPESMEIEGFEVESDTGDISLEDQSAGRVALETDTGSIALQNVSSSETSVKTDTGSIMLHNVSAPEAYVKTDTGKVMMENVTAENLAVKTSTGGVELDSPASEKTDIRTDTGSVTISSLSKPGGYSLDLESDTGAITVNGEKMKGHTVMTAVTRR